MIAAFFAPGVPQPQGNKSAFVVKGRAVMREGRSGEAHNRFKGWRAAVADAARDWCAANGNPPAYDGPIALHLTFYLPRPATAPKRVTLPAKKPDLAKLVRAVEDSLTGIIYTDDARIVAMRVRKVFATERTAGVRVTVAAVTPATVAALLE